MGITYFQPTAGAGVNVSGTPSAGQILEATGANAASWQNGMVQQAATAVAGYTMINGTGNIITWTPPNDGLLHRAMVIFTLHVSVLEVGGAVGVALTKPDGSASNSQIDAGAHAAGGVFAIAGFEVQAGQPVTVQQTSALTAGAAVAWCEIWGS